MEDFTRDIKTPQLPDWLVKPGFLVIPMYKLCPKAFFRKWIWPKIIVEILVEPNPHPGVTQPIRWLGGNIAKSNPVVSFSPILKNIFCFFQPIYFFQFGFGFFYLDFSNWTFLIIYLTFAIWTFLFRLTYLDFSITFLLGLLFHFSI